jgi:hypothetical protein
LVIEMIEGACKTSWIAANSLAAVAEPSSSVSADVSHSKSRPKQLELFPQS